MPSSALSALERKAHMGAPVVEGKEPPAFVDDEDGTMVTMHEEPAPGL
jgi:hypothetical protein